MRLSPEQAEEIRKAATDEGFDPEAAVEAVEKALAQEDEQRKEDKPEPEGKEEPKSAGGGVSPDQKLFAWEAALMRVGEVRAYITKKTGMPLESTPEDGEWFLAFQKKFGGAPAEPAE